MYEKLKNGYLAEELFIVECLKRNIPISRPIFNTEPYDFICELSNNELKRVQVKQCWIDNKNRHITCLKSSYPRSNKCNIVGENIRIDFIAINDFDKWYIIPRKIISNIKSNISVSKKGKYGKFINNFDFNE